MTNEELTDQIIAAINMWGETELKMRWANDGAGHFDFMGLKVTEYGRASLMRVIEASRPVPAPGQAPQKEAR